MPSYEEKFVGQADRLSGKPDSVRTEKSVKSETQDLDMQIHAPISSSLDDNHMTTAVKHLNRDTQRGEHSPTVGGYQHDDKMGR